MTKVYPVEVSELYCCVLYSTMQCYLMQRAVVSKPAVHTFGKFDLIVDYDYGADENTGKLRVEP